MYHCDDTQDPTSLLKGRVTLRAYRYKRNEYDSKVYNVERTCIQYCFHKKFDSRINNYLPFSRIITLLSR